MLAAIIYFTRPDRLPNRLLGLALLLDGLNWLMLVSRVAAAETGVATASLRTQIVVLLAAVFAYLAFLGTLDTPLARVVRGRGARAVLASACAVSVAIILLRPSWFFYRALERGPDPWRWNIDSAGVAAGAQLILLFYTVVLVFAVVAATHAWLRQTPGTPARSRAGWYVAAFAVRDAILLADWIIQLVHRTEDVDPVETVWGPVEMVLVPAGIVTFCAIAAYAILRHQLFNIDLKIKWTLSRGTLGGAFVAVFFIVFAVAEQFLQRYGVLLGGIAVGLLLLAFRPLERAADRLADRAMPGVTDSEEYRTVRKREVYAAAVESALVDGRITEKERDVLATLADHLELGARDVVQIERSLASTARRLPGKVRANPVAR